MLKRVKFTVALLLIATCFLFIITPVLAAPANPDSIDLITTKVFQNIFETNDILFISSYDVSYASEPTEDAEDTFKYAIYDTDGSTLIQARKLNYYQYNVHSIYFNATQASSLNWSSEYLVRVMGNPVYFAPNEDVTMDTMTLSSWSWVEGDAASSREMLVIHCLDLAADLEDAWNLTLIITTPEVQVLNSIGRVVFLDAVPSLDSAVPSLFQTAVSTLSVTQQERTAAYENATNLTGQLGPVITASFEGIGSTIGVSTGWAAAAWAMLFIFVVASIVFLNSGNTTAAMILVLPIIILTVWVGAIPMAALFTLAVIIVVYAAYHLWLRGI